MEQDSSPRPGDLFEDRREGRWQVTSVLCCEPRIELVHVTLGSFMYLHTNMLKRWRCVQRAER